MEGDADEQLTTIADTDQVNEMVIRERNKELRQVEGDVVQLEETFSLLANQVEAQRKLLDTADEEIMIAASEISNGTRSLKEAESYSRRFWGVIVGTSTAVVVGLGLFSAYLRSKDAKPVNNPEFTLEPADGDTNQ